jgi:hypothetical protein
MRRVQGLGTKRPAVAKGMAGAASTKTTACRGRGGNQDVIKKG